MCTPTGCTLFLSFSWSHVHSPSARYRLQCTPFGCAYGCPSGAPIKHVKKVHPKGDNPRGVNFGHNSRDLGLFVRVTFSGQNYRHPIGYPYVGTLSGTHMEHNFFFFVVAPCAPIGHTSWASMHFVHMGTLSGTHFSVPLREIIAPSGQACVCMEVHIFARFHFVISFLCGLLRAL